MARLILAVAPLNQDPNPVVGGGNEMSHVAPSASAVATEAATRGIVVKLSVGTESQDSPRGSCSGLYAQQKAAAAWIAATRQASDLTVSLNLHSDSGTYRHCGYFYDSIGCQVLSATDASWCRCHPRRRPIQLW